MDDRKKFLFDLHNFGDDAAEDDGPPPPPTFSEEELSAAKTAAYEQGKKDGYTDSQNSIEKQISILLENAKQSFFELQSKELEREKVYEQEAVMLALRVFEGIYPSSVSELGPEEVKNAVVNILRNAANQQNIKIDVSSNLLSAIEERLKPIQEELSGISISLNANEALSDNDMRIKWDNGGAVRDSEQLAAQILQSLKSEMPDSALRKEEDLAEKEETRHNEEIETETPDE